MKKFNMDELNLPLIKQAKHDIGLLLISYKMRENSKDIVEGLQKAFDIVNHYCELQDEMREIGKEENIK